MRNIRRNMIRLPQLKRAAFYGIPRPTGDILETFWAILNCAKPSREKGDACCLLGDLGGLCVWMALICDCVL